MTKVVWPLLILAALTAGVLTSHAQPAKVPRVGVVLVGGSFYAAIDGLRGGLRQLGVEEGRHFVLDIRDARGDLKAAEEAARTLERERVDVIYALGSAVAVAVKRATQDTPIVFCSGTDPVVAGLVETFARPGGRLTGVHVLAGDLTAKRLEILKAILPKLRRAVTFYDPQNRSARESVTSGREAAQRLGIELVERPVASVEEFQAALRTLKAGEVDAFLLVSDQVVNSQAQFIIDTVRAKRLPTMFPEPESVEQGGLAAYGVSFHEFGRLSAKHVQRVLAGTKPKDLPVESVDRLDLVVNLRTARELGLTIPPEILQRADKVIR